ncbi:MAG TPA: formimidoylglutamate deiminase [Bryobacteraceae bacterium]|jgi:formimidoylglutamate deiminase|nr:formimidoylglutamate deiminase [Bryobacteraceae bacterium]
MSEAERGWYPDYVWRGGRVESGVALFADHAGIIRRFSSDPADLERATRLRDCAIVPGFVNAHSHAFQRAIRGRVEERSNAGTDSFWTWREAMYRAANYLTPDQIYTVSRMAFLEMLLAGITTVGEFHYLHHEPDGTRYSDPNLLAKTVIRAAADTGLRIVLLRTAYARAGFEKEPNLRQRRFITPDPEQFLLDSADLQSALSGTASIGIAPHSVRAVPLAYLEQCAAYARTQNLPLHMHVAEQPAEIEACRAEYGSRPFELLAAHGILAHNFTAVHATHTTDQEIAAMARAKANICACPTTERNLGDGIAPAHKWAASGIHVSFGSDSNVQIDLLEDARELEYHLRLQQLSRAILPAEKLLEFATRGGARSLCTAAGELEPGRPADFSVFDLNHVSIAGADRASLAAQIVFAAQRGAIREVYVAGQRIISEARHKDQEPITAAFLQVQRSLWD